MQRIFERVSALLGEAIAVNVPVNIASHGQLVCCFYRFRHKLVQQRIVRGNGGWVEEAVASGSHEEGVHLSLLSLAAAMLESEPCHSCDFVMSCSPRQIVGSGFDNA